MKIMILLLSAAYLNGGAYAEADTEVPVGDGKAEITEYRAEELVTAKRASIVDHDGDDGDDERAAAETGGAGSGSGARRQRRG